MDGIHHTWTIGDSIVPDESEVTIHTIFAAAVQAQHDLESYQKRWSLHFEHAQAPNVDTLAELMKVSCTWFESYKHLSQALDGYPGCKDTSNDLSHVAKPVNADTSLQEACERTGVELESLKQRSLDVMFGMNTAAGSSAASPSIDTHQGYGNLAQSGESLRCYTRDLENRTRAELKNFLSQIYQENGRPATVKALCTARMHLGE